MMTEDVQANLKRHRPAALIGGLAGLLLVGGWFGYEIAMTPAQPTVASAPTPEIVSFIINPRGLRKLVDIEQAQFLDRWKERITKSNGKDEVRDALRALSDDDRKSFTEVIFKHLKRVFMDEATHYASLTTSAEKSEFCRKRVEDFSAQQAFMKDLAVVFKDDFPGPDKFQEWVLRHTSPSERQIGEPYVEALKRVASQIKKESRATTTAANG